MNVGSEILENHEKFPVTWKFVALAGIVAKKFVVVLKYGFIAALLISGDLHGNNKLPSLFLSLLLFGVCKSRKSYGELKLVGKGDL